MQSLYPSEVLAFSTRAKGLAYLNFMKNAVKVLNTYVPQSLSPTVGTDSIFYRYII
jgi:hypothetical protein